MLEYLDISIGFATIMLLLSLVVTAVVQAISSLLDLRGNNLVWGLAKFFEQMPMPGMTSKGTTADGVQKKETVSTELAKAIAGHSSIAPSKMLSWYKAKAIRPEELQAIIQKLAASPPTDMSKQAAEAMKQMVTEHVPGKGDAIEQAKAIATQLEALFPARAQSMRETVEQIMGKTQRITAELDTWFGAVMDRSADRFARNSKIWSAGVAVVLALLFQVNAISIFLQITNNTGVRNQLVAMAQPTLQQAEQIQNQANVAGTVLAAMKKEDAYKAQLQNAPQQVATCSEGNTWITSNVGNPGPVAAEFEQRCTRQQVEAGLADVSKAYTALSSTVEKTKLQITGTPTGWNRYQQFGGCLATAILLSLGGPFWYNLLRQMATLRPPTNQKIHEEKLASTPVEATAARAAGAGK
ncbi:MAG TPA: hypothetical protein VFA68_19375 [Terriglobales bacterium]|nr:hypothetical protein [Terriglobales bacterium]